MGIVCFYIYGNLIYNYNSLVITIEIVICDNLLIISKRQISIKGAGKRASC